MKTITLLTTSLAVLASAEQTQAEKDDSFFQGLEQGFFLRNNVNGYKQFECPDLVLD